MQELGEKWKLGDVDTGALDKHGNKLHQFDWVMIEDDEEYPKVPLLVMWSHTANEYVAMNPDGGWVSYDTLHITEKIFNLIPYMKVFKMNDYDWVAALSEDSAMEYYMKETGLSPEDAFDDPHEVSLQDKMWFEFDSLPEEMKPLVETKNFGEIRFARITFEQVIKIENKSEPYLICSTEY